MSQQDLDSPIDKILKEKFDAISQDYTLSDDRMAAILKAAEAAVTPVVDQNTSTPTAPNDNNLVTFPKPAAKPSRPWRSWSIAAGVVLAVAGVLTVQLHSPSGQPSTIAQKPAVSADPAPALQAQQDPLPPIEVAPVEANPHAASADSAQWSAAQIEPAVRVGSPAQPHQPSDLPSRAVVAPAEPTDGGMHMAQAPNTPNGAAPTDPSAVKVIEHLRQLEQQGRADQAERQLAQHE